MHVPGLTRQTYVTQVVRTLWDNLPQVLRGAFLFNLICLPGFCLFALGWPGLALLAGIATIGPAWGALLRYEMQMLQGRPATIRMFFQALRQYGPRCLLLGLMASVPLGALLATLPALQSSMPVPVLVRLGLGADFLGLAIMAILSLYTFPYLVQQDTGTRACVRDALILASRYPTHSLGLLALGILFGFGIAYLSWGLLLLLPAVYGLFIGANCLLVLDMETVR